MTNEKYNIKDLLEMIQENVTYKDNKIKYLLELLMTLLGNLCGTIGCGYLLFLCLQ